MNCKQGDMARVIRDDLGSDWRFPGMAVTVHIGGYVVRCKHQVVFGGEPAWALEDPVDAKFTTSTGIKGSAEVLTIADSLLRPLPPLNEGDEQLADVHLPEQVAA